MHLTLAQTMLGVAFLGGGLLACGEPESETHHIADASPESDAFREPEVATYSVGGSVQGLVSGDLYLQINGAEVEVVRTDGAFAFATELVDGSAYVVDVLAAPSGTACTVENAAGTVAAAPVTEIEVACGPISAALSELRTSLPIVPSFASQTVAYSTDASVLAQSLTITPISEEPGATIRIGAQTVPSGEGVIVPLPVGVTHLEVDVVSSTGEEKTYHLEVRRSDGDVAEVAYGKASNTDASDNFTRVAASGDTLVIGAPGERSSASGVDGDQTDNMFEGAGAAYVFRKVDGVWSQEAYLKASNPSEFHGFGARVAIDGDVIVVGATGDDSNATGVNGDEANTLAPASGAAYVFRRTGTVWSQEAYLKASNTRESELFGSSVAISDERIAVGAILEHSDAQGINGNQTNFGCPSGCGAVYVFHREAGDWVQDAYIKGSNTGSGDRFGTTVALSGTTLAVGVPLEDGSGTGVGAIDDPMSSLSSSGAVYVFERGATAWQERAYIKPSDTVANGLFGTGLALDGDQLVAVATGAVNPVSFEGAAYVFERDGLSWRQDARLRTSSGMSNAVALKGDLLGLGVSQFQDHGAVEVFRKTVSGWRFATHQSASNREPEDFFGRQFVFATDSLIVTAREDSAATGMNGDSSNNLAPNSGAFYVFE